MRKTCLLIMLLGLLCGSIFAEVVSVSADVSCRTDILYPTTNRSDSSKLSVRSDASSNKSYIKFDLSTIDPNMIIRSAELRLALHEAEGSGTWTFDVSAVNDDCVDNIGWAEKDITWGNAPANNTADWYNPDFTKATKMGTISFDGDTSPVGSQFFVDVTSALQGDTDDIVQFILHNSNTLLNCATHDHSGGAEYWPTLLLTLPPAGADWPVPEDGATTTSDWAELSWTNPDPNDVGGSITCTVYMGTEPNILTMDSVVLNPEENSVSINETNFPNVNPLQDLGTYYWVVNCYDSSLGDTIPGEMWSFDIYDNQPPYNVNAGDDQVTWMTKDPNTVDLVGTAEDDGGAPTITWEETAGPGTSIISSPDQLSTTVSFVEAGDYTFTLSADDGDLPAVTDTVRVVVGDSPCDATHVFNGTSYNAADQNQDCIVDLVDFVALIVDDWLNCTDDLTNCAN